MSVLFQLFVALVSSLFSSSATEPCRIVWHRSSPFAICTFSRDAYELRLYHRDDKEKAYASLKSLSQALEHQPAMLMNAGMYHPDLSPVGLYVEQGVEHAALNLDSGSGNFFWQPNGVFWGDEQAWHITSTQDFAKNSPSPTFATQSGPMLVLNAMIHPEFKVDSKYKKIRNAVGIDKSGKIVYFVLSAMKVDFWTLATVFSEHLQAEQALYLDGVVSSLQSPAFHRKGETPLGPIIAAFPNSDSRP